MRATDMHGASNVRRTALAAAALLAGCFGPAARSPDAGATVDTGASSAARIGPAGGSVTLGDAVVRVPAGATAAEVEVRVSVTVEEGPTDARIVGDVLAIEPHGATFDVPVTIEIALPPPYVDAELWTRDAGSGSSWTRVEGARVEDAVLTAEVDHFSYFVLVDPGMSWEPIFVPAGQVRGLTVHGGLAYVLTDTGVLRSPDGVTWSDVSAGLPDYPAGSGNLTTIATTSFGVHVGTTNGLYAFDGARFADRSAGLPDGGFGRPAAVHRVTSDGINDYLAGGTVDSLYVATYSRGSGRWVTLATIPDEFAAASLGLVTPGCLAVSGGGTTSSYCVRVPGGEVTRIPITDAPFVRGVERIDTLGEIWTLTEQDLFVSDHPFTPPTEQRDIESVFFADARDVLDLPASGEVLVATSRGAGMYLTEDGTTFLPIGGGLPSEPGVLGIVQWGGSLLVRTDDTVYRGRPSTLSCGLPGDACDATTPCCAGTCSGATCVSDACGAVGASCRSSQGCCSASCVGGICRPQAASTCALDGESCTTRRDCCRGDCTGGVCVDSTHCRCAPTAECGSADGCGGSCPGSCPSGTSCLEAVDGWDFCAVPCADWQDCRRLSPDDPTYCCTAIGGTGVCARLDDTCDTDFADAGEACGAASGLGCRDPDPTDADFPYCCPPGSPAALTCSCTLTALP